MTQRSTLDDRIVFMKQSKGGTKRDPIDLLSTVSMSHEGSVSTMDMPDGELSDGWCRLVSTPSSNRHRPDNIRHRDPPAHQLVRMRCRHERLDKVIDLVVLAKQLELVLVDGFIADIYRVTKLARIEWGEHALNDIYSQVMSGMPIGAAPC